VAELRFNEAGHSYALDGRAVPSVTTVMQDVGLIDYSGIPPAVREQALERGRIVHTCTQYDDELSIEGQQLDPSQIDPAVAGYVEAWRRFRRETGFTPELIEHRAVNHAHCGLPAGLYAGTLDRTGRFGGQSSCVDLLDIKTGTACEWVRYQLSAYAAFFPHPRTLRRYCVELHDDGTYKVPFVFEARDWQRDFNVFISALNVFMAKHPDFGSEGKRRAA
jgi:hypothetical protein